MHIVGTPSRTVTPTSVISSNVWLCVESPLDGDRAAGRERRDDARRQSEHVRERGCAEHDVVRAQLERLGGVHRRCADAAVRQHRTLRLSGGARREEDDRRCGSVADGHVSQRVAELEHCVVTDQQLRRRDGDALLHFRLRQQDVERHDDRPEPPRTEEQRDELRDRWATVPRRDRRPRFPAPEAFRRTGRFARRGGGTRRQSHR